MANTTETIQPAQELLGHTSPETAYLVADYPYGFRLRTEIRYWIETKKGHGQRLVSQTRNPKKDGSPWNKPKAGIYAPLVALYLDSETGHVEHAALHPYDEERIAAFVAAYPLTAATEDGAKRIAYARAPCGAQSRATGTVTRDSDSPQQSPKEQAAIMHKLTVLELHKLADGDGVTHGPRQAHYSS